jgi:hypothetical protein
MDYVHNTLLPNLLKEETKKSREEMGEEAYQEKLRSFFLKALPAINHWSHNNKLMDAFAWF